MKRVFCIIALLALVAGCQTGPRRMGGTGMEAPEGPGPQTAMPYEALQQNSYGPEGLVDTDPDIHIDKKDMAWMVYASNSHTKHYHLFKKRTGGQGPVQLTFGPANFRFPSWSPDGKKVAFSSDRAGSWDIWIMDVSRPSALWQVTYDETTDEIAPSWSRDGSRIVFSQKNPREQWDMWIVDLKSRMFTKLGPGLFPKWSPPSSDRDEIVFQKPRYRDHNYFGIWVVSPEGNDAREVISSTRWAAINPSWSPDGRWITFATVQRSFWAMMENRVSEADDIYYIRSDGSGIEVQLTEARTPEWMPMWANDGRIYFVSKREGRSKRGERTVAQNIYSLVPVLFDDMGAMMSDDDAMAEDGG